jgi:predicted ATPase
VTAFVGANSAGKTTLLAILNEVLSFLKQGDFSATRKSKDKWMYDTATLRFVPGSDADAKLPSLADTIGGESKFLEIAVSATEKELLISRIMSSNGSIRIPDIAKPYLPNSRTAQHQTTVTALRAEIARLEAQKRSQQSTLNISQTKNKTNATTENQIANANDKIRQLQAELPGLEVEIINFLDAETSAEATVSRNELKIFLKGSKLPSVKYIPFGIMPADSITNLVNTVLESKVGKNTSHYEKTRDDLSLLLQSQVAFWGTLDGTDRQIAINGIGFERLSHGAQVCLLYYSFVFDTNEDTVVIWDEPENGLHHSRRFKLMELLLGDQRQYVIATHAPELCPILEKKAQVYQCRANYNSAFDQIELDIESASTRRDAFRVLESLGVSPASTLFTSNIVIWVEGPSDVAYWRFWLNQRDIEKKLIEGFDYTLMFYGGSTIANLDLADVEGRYVNADILSLCRHPIVIVDSDLEKEPTTPNSYLDHLKPGAAKARAQIDAINSERPDAAKFMVLEAREIENYLPKEASIYAFKTLSDIPEDEWKRDGMDAFGVGRFKHYQTEIRQFLHTKAKFKRNDERVTYPGVSKWGRKTEFMSKALETPGLSTKSLDKFVSTQLEELYLWIRSKKENK